jgi:hypothetical protein
MTGMIIKGLIVLGLGVASGPVLAQTEQPAAGQGTDCPTGSQAENCVMPEGGAQQGATSGQQETGKQPNQQGSAKTDRPKAADKATQGEAAGEAGTTAEQPNQPEQGSGTAAQGSGSAGGTEQPKQGSGTEQPAQGTTTQTEQGTQQGGTSTKNQTVNVTVEQKTEITQVIKETKIEPVNVDFDVKIGIAVPQTIKVKLQPLPQRIVKIVPAYQDYLFFVLADGRIVIVEPSTLKIIVILV